MHKNYVSLHMCKEEQSEGTVDKPFMIWTLNVHLLDKVGIGFAAQKLHFRVSNSLYIAKTAQPSW